MSFPSYDDPLEPVNRAIFKLNESVLIGLGEPIARLYRGIVPRIVRSSAERAFDNLLYPGRLINNLLQGQFDGAWRETERFAINSTVGIAGLRDPATRWGIEPSVEDFGQTFQAWGWKRSTFLMAPFFGAITWRDSVGFFGDWCVDIAAYYTPAAQVRSLNRLSDQLPGLVTALRSQYDPYELSRFLYLLSRDAMDVFDPAAESSQANAVESAPGDVPAGTPSGATDTLGAVFLVPESPEFVYEAQRFSVIHPSTGKEISYSVWLQPDAAPVDYIIPGLGGHRLGSSSVALAEVVYSTGQSAVTISSSLNFEFIESALTEAVPGFIPSDARDTHELLGAIDADLRTRFPGRILGQRVGGISFGGITTLFIAAAEKDPDLIDFEAYVAINAPLSLAYGAQQLDAFYNSPLEIPEEERRAWLDQLFAKTLRLTNGNLEPDSTVLPFTRDEARFIIGLLFRTTIQDVIFQTQVIEDLGVLHAPIDSERRTLVEGEIEQFSFMEYIYAFALPAMAQSERLSGEIDVTEAGAEHLLELCSVRSIQAELAANPRVRFVTNRNDFLLAPGDLEWITELLGEDRVTVFERGGHLGNLHLDEVRKVIESEIDEATEVSGPTP
ncbi:VacJ family lipoprotein [Saltatorellus ferox]|uniref:MlaA family lipoprotein n=1 Tax=Saltatorellus ferox TaxID=2528018 RepID=UPI003AF3A52E